MPRYIRAAAPDVVIHLGDLTLDGTHDPGDLRYGRRQLDRLPVPWHAVPGNHDVGDNPRPGAPEAAAVDATRQQRWNEIIGADHWSLALGGWLLLAINAQQYRRLREGGTDHLWAPTTWAVLPDDVQPVLGAKRCGIVALESGGDGPPEPELVEPDGIAQLTVGSDLPDPYHR